MENFTKTPNVILDNMPNMKNSVFVICMAVARKTLGYQKEWDKISNSQFIRLTGLSNKGVSLAIDEAIAAGWIERRASGNTYEYSVKGANSVLSEQSMVTESTNSVRSFDTEYELSLRTQFVDDDKNYELSSYTKENNNNLPTVGADAPQTVAETFHTLLAELKSEDAKNRTAILRRIFVLCYGEQNAPDYGYIGKVAKSVGSAGYLAQRLWELTTRPPNGDVLAYILQEYKAKKKREKSGYQNGTATQAWSEMFENQDVPEYMQ